jgi:hypothetical protein
VYGDALLVVVFNAAGGRSRDIWGEIAGEVADRGLRGRRRAFRGHEAVYRPAREAGVGMMTSCPPALAVGRCAAGEEAAEGLLAGLIGFRVSFVRAG